MRCWEWFVGDSALTKQSKYELVRLVEQAMREVGRFDDRAAWLCIDELEAAGQPIERIRIWATLHFLPDGSPFDSEDADLWVWPLRDEVSKSLQRELGLTQSLNLELVAIATRVHPGVKFIGDGGHCV
jgi:hypothetical protein